MKFTKKNVLAIGAAVMMTASLATFASASSLPESAPADVCVASVKAVDIDVSTLDFSEMLEGTPVALKAVASEDAVPCTLSTEGLPTDAAACISAAEVVDFDPSAMDFSEMLEGEPIVVSVIDFDGVSGTAVTQAK